jgi:hypothetical protein
LKTGSTIQFEESSGKRGFCDEYPFSTSRQGGPVNYAAGKVSVRMVSAFEQSRQGGQIGEFFTWANVARDGYSVQSKFLAIAIPGVKSFAINRQGNVYKWEQ